MTIQDVPANRGYDAWVAALEARHLSDLRFADVSRSLRALSSAYVERRGRLADGAALDGAGKRAAFALFYGPQHFLLVRHIVGALGAARAGDATIADLGCGTGVAGAAWALASQPPARVLGFDRHPWAAEESRWTYRCLGLDGSARQADASRLAVRRRPDAAVAAYVLNELAAEARDALLRTLAGWVEQGTAVLVVEPIARGVAPWMEAQAVACAQSGGRYDEWRVAIDLPPIVRRLEVAAGLDCRELKARTLYWPSSTRRP